MTRTATIRKNIVDTINMAAEQNPALGFCAAIIRQSREFGILDDVAKIDSSLAAMLLAMYEELESAEDEEYAGYIAEVNAEHAAYAAR
jgi:hypothetical protein